jgi:hypothetical protein
MSSRTELNWEGERLRDASFLQSSGIIIGKSGSPGPLVPASQLKVAQLPTTERKVVELKTPLDERGLDRLMLASDAAVVAYQEQRLRSQTVRKARDNRQRADLAHTQTDEDDEVA